MIEGKLANLFPRKTMNGTVVCGKCSTNFEAPAKISVITPNGETENGKPLSMVFQVHSYLGKERFIYESKSGRAVCYCSEYCARKHNHRFTKRK